MSFRNWKLRSKILACLGIIGISFSCFVLFVTLPAANAKMVALRKDNLKNFVEIAIAVLEDAQHGVEENELSKSEAMAQALKPIRGMKYGENGYYWIDNGDYICQLLPPKPAAEQKYRGDLLDKKDQPIIKLLVDGAVQNGSTYLEYWFPKPGDVESSSKWGYAQHFKPFDWVIGTGLYFDDLEAQLAEQQLQALWDLAPSSSFSC